LRKRLVEVLGVKRASLIYPTPQTVIFLASKRVQFMDKLYQKERRK